MSKILTRQRTTPGYNQPVPMNLSTRSLGLALLLLLLFLGATLTVQWWLSREIRQLQASTISEQRGRLMEAIAASGWTPADAPGKLPLELGAMFGGSVEFLAPGVEPPPSRKERAMLSFLQEFPSAPGWRVRVRFAAPPLLRVELLHQRALAVIVVLSLLVATVPLLMVLIGSRRSSLPEGASRMPWAATRSNALGLEHFARISNERTAALELEQGARQRAEENLRVNRNMLHHSVEERVRLGRELHDNICQTLYAVCLTLESVRKKNTLSPELKQRVDQCMGELRRLNQEVRSYLTDLEPAREEAIALIPQGHIADIMNILREAVSNGLRHGQAGNISLLAARNDREIALAVQDDGVGFDPVRNGGAGHGLSNMQARAAAVGGTVRIESAPGKGTRVLLSLPVASRA